MKFLTILFLVAHNLCCTAQVRFKHSASVELTGPPAVRYDYMFRHAERGFWDVGATVGGSKPEPEVHFIEYRANSSYNFGRSNYFFELGISLIAADVNNRQTNPQPNDPSPDDYFGGGPFMGFRQIGNKGLSFRFYAGLRAGDWCQFIQRIWRSGHWIFISKNSIAYEVNCPLHPPHL